MRMFLTIADQFSRYVFFIGCLAQRAEIPFCSAQNTGFIFHLHTDHGLFLCIILADGLHQMAESSGIRFSVCSGVSGKLEDGSSIL